MTDQIIVEELELMCQIGITEEERSAPQRLTINLTLTTARDFNGLRDDFKNAVDYVKVAQRVQDFAASRPRRLLETLATEIAEELLQHFAVSVVEMHLRKFVMPGTRAVGVRLRRDRATPGGRRI